MGAKTLFATHYHQLTELADSLLGVRNCSMAVREQGSEIVFLRKVVEGRANKSYGIQVAKLAGVPQEVVARAEEVLDDIQERSVIEVKARRGGHAQAKFSLGSEPVAPSALEELRKLDLSDLSPMEAYVRLAEIKKRLGGGDGKD